MRVRFKSSHRALQEFDPDFISHLPFPSSLHSLPLPLTATKSGIGRKSKRAYLAERVVRVPWSVTMARAILRPITNTSNAYTSTSGLLGAYTIPDSSYPVGSSSIGEKVRGMRARWEAKC